MKRLTLFILLSVFLLAGTANAREHYGHSRHGHSHSNVGRDIGLFGAGVVVGAVLDRAYTPSYERVVVYQRPYYQPVRYYVPAQPREVQVTLNNDDGSATTVILTRRNGGWLGPQGEWYSAFPSSEYLATIYGR